MFGFGTKPKPLLTIKEAEIKVQSSGVFSAPMELRKKVPIVAIDDKVFAPERNLKNTGFLIETLDDIQRVSDIEKYQIILCDVNGVGTALSEDTQGAYVIEEIKNSYPDKMVIAYTAGSASSKLVHRAKAAADFSIRKDANVEEWRDLLDNVIKELCNPIIVWKKTRVRLLNAGIELEELMRLEQAFLLNLDKGKEGVRGAMDAEMRASGGASWKSEISQFLASKAFDLAFEYIVQ